MMNRRRLFGMIGAAVVAVLAAALMVKDAADPVAYAPPGTVVFGADTAIDGGSIKAPMGLRIPNGVRSVSIKNCQINCSAKASSALSVNLPSHGYGISLGDEWKAVVVAGGRI